MTCIIGLEANGRVYMGADSCGSDDWTNRAYDIQKVFRVKQFIIGYTSSFRMGQLLQYALVVTPQNGTDDLTYLVTIMAEAVRDAFKAHGYAYIENSQEFGGLFLVGYRGKLYQISSDFSVLHTLDGYSAVGSGHTVALGVMAALEGLSPKKRILKALEITGQFVGSVKPPYKVMKL
jgi:ATP-dependent protease HslVU (ClpYQ) peptidase subunit